jgi:hypothetical protein
MTSVLGSPRHLLPTARHGCNSNLNPDICAAFQVVRKRLAKLNNNYCTLVVPSLTNGSDAFHQTMVTAVDRAQVWRMSSRQLLCSMDYKHKW